MVKRERESERDETKLFSIIIDLALDHCYHNTHADEVHPSDYSALALALLPISKRLHFCFDSYAHCDRVPEVEYFSPVVDGAKE